MQCLYNYTNNSKDSKVVALVGSNINNNANRNNYDNSSYLYLLSLKAFAKLIVHTCNVDANQPLLTLQRTLLDIRRIPLTVTVLQKVYDEVLIPLTKYVCVNDALANSNFT